MQTIANFFQHTSGDFILLGRQMRSEIAEPCVGIADRHIRDFADVTLVDFDRERFGLQTEAVAIIAACDALKAFDLFARPCAVRLAPATLQIGDDAFKRF